MISATRAGWSSDTACPAPATLTTRALGIALAQALHLQDGPDQRERGALLPADDRVEQDHARDEVGPAGGDARSGNGAGAVADDRGRRQPVLLDQPDRIVDVRAPVLD